MSQIIGVDGEEAKDEQEPNVPVVQYRIGGVEVGSPETPEAALERATVGAKQMAAQQAAAVAMQQVQDRSIAQQAANAAANNCNNPFLIEPAAQAVFMLVARELEWRDSVIAKLCERLDKIDGESSKDLLEKPWASSERENEHKDTFDDAVKNLTR